MSRFLLLAALLHPVGSFAVAAEPSEPAVTFEKSILPILTQKCVRCHGADVQKGQLALHTGKSLRAGSESGPVIIAGKPDESRLLEVVESAEMPPDGKDPLTPDETDLLRRWIEADASFQDAADSSSEEVTEHQAIPVLLLRCAVCHGGRRREAELDVRTRESLLHGGKSGPAIVPGNPEESLLVKRVAHGEMPPLAKLTEAMVKPMEPTELVRITQWIAQGARGSPAFVELAGTPDDPLVRPQDREFWSFQPPRDQSLPLLKDSARITNAIDVFIAARLEPLGLRLAPDADRATLLRRVAFDLTGLPPTPAEIAGFLADDSPDAYAKQVERYLASPRYGERWGRHWLDLAGYADCEGRREQHLPRPFAWRYRDYVIRSLNDDKPYDRFLQEQIAGDELFDYRNAPEITQEIEDALVATGFLRMTADPTWANLTGFVPDRLEVMADSMDVLGAGVLGLSLKCARCHSHKFDPIPQRDYYRLVAVFKGAYDEHDWLKPDRQGYGGAMNVGLEERTLPYVTTAERRRWQEQNAAIDRQIAEIKAGAVLGQVSMDAEVEKRIQALEAQRPREPHIFALWDRGDPSPTYIYRRGDYLIAGDFVTPGPPAVLSDSTREISKPATGSLEYVGPGGSTGRRLEFARWLTHPDHPLTARVLVNRVWHHHFGRGIVRSLGNFGRMGNPPTHPELLDWLAREFHRQGQSLKALHRLILLSGTYRQSSLVSPAALAHDPDNRLLSRAPLRRLDAEQVRDTLLVAADELDRTRFGPGDPVQVRADGLVSTGRRRSVYLQQLRKHPVTLLETFDLPQMNPNCLARSESLVAPQALFLLNDSAVRRLARQMAAKICVDAATRDEQIRLLFERALGRPPAADERERCLAVVEDLEQQWHTALQTAAPSSADLTTPTEAALQTLCHTIFNSAAFLYLD